MSTEVPSYLRDVVGKSPDKVTIAGLSGEERSTFLQGWVMLRFHEEGADWNVEEKKVVPTLTDPMRNHYFVFWVSYKIGNGGFGDYFDLTEPPQFIDEAIAAFEAIGAKRHSRALRDAQRVFNGKLIEFSKIKDEAKQDRFLDKYWAELEKVCKKYHDLDWFLLKERLDYIEKNIDKFHKERSAS